MSVNLAPGPFGVGGQFFSGNTPLNGGLVYTYAAGTTTPQPTFTTSTGSTPNANPITLSANGIMPQEMWLTAGIAYKIIVTDSVGTVIYLYTMDNLSGINDFSSIPTGSEWIASGLTPTFVSTSSFTVPGDQTVTGSGFFTANRRLFVMETAGTIYGVVTSASVTSSITTVNVSMDAGAVIDAGITAVSYGLLNSVNPSIPQYLVAGSGAGVSYANGIPTISALGLLTVDFRLTLTTLTPVTTVDVAAATTIFCSPYKGNRIALYNGTQWNVRTSAEFSLALGTLTSGRPYDVFCFDSAGVPTLEFLAWTSTTARATALVLQDGVLCKSGVLTRRYLGTFYTISTTQTADSSTVGRYLWNYYNRIARPMLTTYSVDRTSTSATYVEPNIEIHANFVLGVSEDPVTAGLAGSVTSSAGENRGVAVAFDSATVPTPGFELAGQNLANAASSITVSNSSYLAIGLHYATLIAKSPTGQLTFSTATGGTVAKAYLIASLNG